jgi:hypothetical protein
VTGRSTVALVRESLMFKIRESSNVFNIVNSVNCLKEYCLPLSVFMGEDHQLFAKSPHSSELKEHCTLVRESLVFEARGFSTLLSIVNCCSFSKEYCLPISVSMGEEPHVCAKLHLSSDLNQYCLSCKRTMNVASKRVKHLIL